MAAPPAETLARAFAALSGRVPRLEWLTAPEEGELGRTGDPVDDLRAILAVHPMREADARAYLERGGLGARNLDRLIARGILSRLHHAAERFVALRRSPEEAPRSDITHGGDR